MSTSRPTLAQGLQALDAALRADAAVRPTAEQARAAALPPVSQERKAAIAARVAARRAGK